MDEFFTRYRSQTFFVLVPAYCDNGFFLQLTSVKVHSVLPFSKQGEHINLLFSNKVLDTFAYQV